MSKPVVVKQTLYDTQLIKLKHVEDSELWREILSFRQYTSFEQEVKLGFIPDNYETINPNHGLETAVRTNHIFLTNEYIRLGANNIINVINNCNPWKSLESIVIILKKIHNNNGIKKYLCTMFINEYRKCYTDIHVQKIIKFVPKDFISKEINKLPDQYGKNNILTYMERIYRFQT